MADDDGPPAPRQAAGGPGGWWEALADLVLPRVCAGCAVPGEVLCAACRSWLAAPRLAQPRHHPAGFPPTVAAGAYAGPVLLVPVPSSAAAVQRRGRDHVTELARAAAAELGAAGVPARPAALLRRRRGTRDSAGLDAVARRANLSGRFAVRTPRHAVPAGSAVVVVDDVVTSGATLCESARALTAAGVTGAGVPVLAATVAATPRRPPRHACPDGAATFTVRGWNRT